MKDALARLEFASVDSTSVVRIVGEVDLSNAAELEAQILEHLSTSTACLLDLTDVTYLDSSGLRLLDRIRRAAERAGEPLAVVAAPDSIVRHLLDLVGIGALIDLHPSLEAARASMGQM